MSKRKNNTERIDTLENEKDTNKIKTNKKAFEEDDSEVPKNVKNTLKRLILSIKDEYKRLAIVIVSVIFYTALTIAAPVYSAKIIDLLWNAIQNSMANGTTFSITWEQGGFEICILLLIYIVTAIFYILQKFMMTSFSERLSFKLRNEISNKINLLPLSYFDNHKPGEILSKATNDLDKMSEAIQTGLLTLFTSVGTVIGSIIMMFYYNVTLTIIFIVFMALSLILTKVFSKKTLKYATERQEKVAKLTAQIEEAYSGRVIIKSFNREETSMENMANVTNEVAVATRKADFIINAINPAIRLINRLGQVAIAILAGKMLIEGRLTVGGFQAFLIYLNQSAEPLTEASYMINSLQSSLASVERIYEMLDEAEISPEPEHPEKVENAKGDVEFSHVHFGYSPNKILMEDVGFKAKRGQKIAIVGNTGAGKTTLINLLMRFYDINGGKILLDGKDTKNLTRANLRSNFGMVLQDTWLFEGTVAENIAYGKPDATREEIIEAAKMARIDFFIRTMPKGYDTVLENDTEGISVGQRQLITIARVMLCNPSVLILDEATSSVDTRTEIEIGKAMQALMANRTSFVIAHRLSTIVDSDLILFMRNGTIIEQGNHKELLEKNGAYAELYNSQFA